MTKSGLADSPFFSLPPKVATEPEKLEQKKPSLEEINKTDKTQKAETKPSSESKEPRYHDTVIPRNHDTMVSSNHDTTIELVRKAVKELGKEAATHRFTVGEKKAVLDLIYTYKNSGIRTSENEVARIAINYILEDYKKNGKNSTLDKVLRALNE